MNFINFNEFSEIHEFSEFCEIKSLLWSFMNFNLFFMDFHEFQEFAWQLWFLTPKARRRSRLTTKWSDSKSLYLEIDAPSDANSFEIGKLRLPAFQNGVFVKFRPQNDL